MITQKQNEPIQLARLAAQRQLHASAKSFLGAQIILGVPIAIATALVARAVPEWKDGVALWGMLASLLVLLLAHLQKCLQHKAARMQELFDCEVLSLDWNPLKGTFPDHELVKDQSDKYRRHMKEMPSIENWYPIEVEPLPLPLARLVCQRTNCEWDSKLRRYYAILALVIVTLVFLSLLMIACLKDFSLSVFLINVVGPFAPVFVLGIRQYREHTEAAERSRRLKEYAEQLWKNALSGTPTDQIVTGSRRLQDEIFERRRQSPPVFDFVYRPLQKSYEEQAKYAARQMVDQAKQRLGIATS